MIKISDDMLHEIKIRLRSAVQRERRLYPIRSGQGAFSDTMLDDIINVFVLLSKLNPKCEGCANDVKKFGEWTL